MYVESTKTIIRECWKVGYEIVTIEETGQDVYAYPSYVTFRGEQRTRDVPLWRIMMKELVRGGCSTGSGNTPRGDQAQNCTNAQLVPGVFIKGLPHMLFGDEDEATTIRVVEMKLGGESASAKIWCSHGNTLECDSRVKSQPRYYGCPYGCFEGWGGYG